MFDFLKRKKKADPAGAQKPAPAASLKQSLRALEQRLMFDAAAAATAAEVKSEQVAQDQAEAAVSSEPAADGASVEPTDTQEFLHAIASYTPGESTVEVVFVDPTVPDYQSLIAGLGPNVEVVVLDGGRDGMEQIAAALSGRTGIDAIHLISHGSEGQLLLGTGTLSHDSMTGQYADELATIKQALSEQADILVYGCDFAEGQGGQDAATLLSQLTGADVAASTDDTGYAGLGGDWDLEVQTGAIETRLAVTDQLQADWVGLLDISTGLTGRWTFDTNANDSSGNNYNGTLTNGAVVDTTSSTNLVGDGKVSLDGVNDYVDLSAHSGSLAGLTQGTIAGWIKTTSTFETLFSISDTADTGSSAALSLGASGYLTYEVWENGILQLGVYRSSATINDGNWHHVAVTVGASGNSLYVDGVLATAGQLTYDAGNATTQHFLSSVTSLDSMAIGRNQGSGGGTWHTNGLIDDVRVYSRVLTAADMAELANDVPIIANLSGDSLAYSEGAGAVVIEQGGNVTISDVDSANFDTGTLTVSIPSGGDSAEDVLSIRSQGTGAGQIGVSGSNITYGGVTIGTFTGGSSGSNLVITFNASATPTAVTALVKHITYENTDTAAPTTGARTVRYVLTDGDGGTSANYDTTVTVSGVNDAPTFGTGDGRLTTAIGSGDDLGTSVTVQADGKVLVAGASWNGSNSNFALTRYNSDGTLDTSFGGGDGMVTTDLGSNTDYGTSVTVQADGKILVAGQYFNGSTYDFALVRYNSDGTLDSSFGGGDGIVTTNLGLSHDVATSVAVQADGKILVAGYSDNGSDVDFALTRYNSNGTLDTSFGGGDGMVTTAVGAGADFGTSMTVQVDGKILVAGYSFNGSDMDFALTRYTSDGTLDTSFGGGDGKVTTAVGFGADSGTSVTVQADGKILVAGYSDNGSDVDFALVRYTSDGALDTSFGGGDGKVTTAVGFGADSGTSVTVQADGKILVAGTSFNGSKDDFALVRYTSDGTLDTSFGGGDGIVTTAVGASNDIGNSVAVQSDGKILVAGYSFNGTKNDFALVRYNSDGTLDTTFDSVLPNTLNGTPTVTEGGAAVVLDADVQIFDAELSAANNFNGATLTLVRNGGANAEDVFSATGTLSLSSGNVMVSGTTIGTYTNSGGTLEFTFNGNATQTLVNSAMQQIAYSNSSDVPPASAQINWTFNDGNLGSQGSGGALHATGSTTVTITAVNDAPTITNLSGDSVSYSEGAGAVVIEQGGNVTISDVDSANFDTGTLTVSIPSGGDSAEDVLSIRSQGTGAGQIGVSGSNITYGGVTIGTFTGGTSGANLVITLNSSATPTAVTALVKNITYENTDTNTPTTGARTVRYVLTDGDGGTSANYDTTVTITAVNSVPVNTVPGAQTTNEDTALVFSSGNGNLITIAVADGAINEVTISVSNGTLTLAGTTGLTFTTGDGTTDTTMTFRGTVSAINTALNGLSYNPMADYNGSATLTITSVDGTLVSLNIDANLQARYTFNGTANDVAPGTAQNGTLTGGASIVTDGTRGQVLQLDGNDSVEVSGLYGSSQTVTLTAWVNLSAGRTDNYVISLGDSIGLALDGGSGGSGGAGAGVYGYYYDGTTWRTTNSHQFVAGTGWHHVAYTFNDAAKTQQIYVDGALQATSSFTEAISYTLGANTSIGKHGNANSFYMDGKLDDVQVYNRVLSATEIANLANDLALTDTDTVSITVNAVNDAPTDLSLSANTVAENAANGTVVGTVSGTDVDAGDTKAYSLTDTAGGRFAINSSTGQITVANGSLLNYEAATSHSVTVRVTDSGGLTYDEIFTINLTNVNEAPLAVDDRAGLTFDGLNDFVEMGSGVAYEVTDTVTLEAWINRDASSNFRHQIISKEGEYEIALDTDGTLMWAFANTNPGWVWHSTGVSIPVHTWAHVAVTYDHGTITSYVDGVVVETYAGSGTIGDAHPTFDSLRIGGRENNPAGEYFSGQISEVLVWNTARTAGEVASDLNGTLTGSETGLLGYWKFNESAGTTADNLTANSDGTLGGGIADQSPQWATYRVNEDVTLTVSGAGVLGNDFDVDGDTLSAIMVTGPSHASAFTLNPDGSFSYTPSANFSGADSFTYRVSDGTQMSNVATVRILVDPVNDAPVLALGGTNLITNGSFESGAAGWIGNSGVEVSTNPASYGVSAPPDGTHFLEVEAGGSASSPSYIEQTMTTVVGQTYVVSLSAITRMDKNVQDMGALSINGVEIGRFTTGTSWQDYAVSFTATSTSSTLQIISGGSLSGSHAGAGDTAGLLIDHVQVVAVQTSAAHTEGGAPTVLAGTARVFDAELSTANNFTGATLTLARTGGANAEDVFSATGTLSLSGGNVTVSGTTIGTYTNSGGTLAFTFNGNATNALVNSAMQQIAYSNSSDAPPASAQIDWTFNDGNSGTQGAGSALTATGSTTVTITAVNDAPTITNLSSDSLSYNEGAGPVVIEQGDDALVADVDSSNLDTGTLTVSIPAGGDSAEDVLSIQNQGTGAGQIGVSGANVTYQGVTIGTFTGGSSGSNLVITLNSNATPTAVTALVKNITYENTDTAAPTTGARTVRYVLTDGDGGTSANYDTTVTVSGVNDAPTDLALSANTVAENAANGTVVGTITGTDPDSGDTKTYSFTDSAGGRFAINSSTGQITVADGTLLNYEAATNHSVTVRVTDSGGLTYDETFTINLTNGNEGPAFSNLNATPTYIEGGAAVVLDSDVEVVDPELSAANNFNGATLTLQRNGGANSQDIFSATGTLSALIDEGALVVNGITIGGVLQNANGTLVLLFGPNATGTLVNQAMQQIAYSNSSDAPPASAQIDWTFNDGNSGTQGAGSALTATGSSTVSITAVNDAPTAVTLSGGTVAENAANGTVVGTAGTTDPDAGDAHTYQLTNNAGGRFTINSSTGVITVADGTLLDYEAATSHMITIRTTDAGGLTHDHVVTIAVSDLNELSPTTIVPGPLLPGPSPLPPAPLAPTTSGPVTPGPTDGGGPMPTASVVSREAVHVVSPPMAAHASLSAVPVLGPGHVQDGDTHTVLEEARGLVAWTVVEPVLNLLHEAADQLRALAQSPEIPVKLSEFIVKELDAMTESLEQAMEGRQDEETLVAATAAGVSIVLSTGYVVWALRGGWLLASLMATMPAWRSFDPLPVLVRAKEDRDREGTRDDRRAARREDERIENLFGSDEGRAA